MFPALKEFPFLPCRFFPVRSLLVTCLILLYAAGIPLSAFSAERFSGELNDIKGMVEVLKRSQKKWFKAINGLPVQLYDQIRTGEDSSCVVELDDGSLIFVDANTHTSLRSLEITAEKHDSKLLLMVGRVVASIARKKNTKMKIRTPVSVGAVRGTEFAVATDGKAANIGVFEGQVAVKSVTDASSDSDEDSPAGEVLVNPDEETSVAQGSTPSMPSPLQELMLRNKERMAQLRGRVQELRERLKRVPPEELQAARSKTLERFRQIKEERQELREKTRQERERIKPRKTTP